MTLLEHRVTADDVLDYIDESVRALQEAGMEPRTVLVGPAAYAALRQAMAARFHRAEGLFEHYQWLTIVVDPLRADAVLVLPPPRDVVAGVDVERA